MPPDNTVSIDLRVEGAYKLRDLVREMRRVGRGDMRKHLYRALRVAAGPVVAEVKAAAIAIPVSGRHRTQGLRRSTAAATRVQTRQDGVRIRTATARMPAGKEALPRLWDQARGWRHPVPVRGGAPRWVRQDGHPWFYRTLKSDERVFRAAINRVIDNTATELERSVR